MKRLCLLLLTIFSASFSFAQSEEAKDYSEKVKTLDSTIEALYGVISGDAGVKRGWDLFRYLFKEDAKLIPSGRYNEVNYGFKTYTP
ncbi:MAG: hypothetical protein ACI8YQ_000946 [Polaribacter sp.]|jgi:hypothetical protein